MAEFVDSLGGIISDQDFSQMKTNGDLIRQYSDELVEMGVSVGGNYAANIAAAVSSLLLVQTNELARLAPMIAAAVAAAPHK